MLSKKLSRRDFLVSTLAMTGAAALAACAAPAGTSDEAEGGASTEPITILFHSRLGTHADWHVSRIPLFEEQNPGLKLEVDELPGNEMYPKIYALAASGTVGDVVWTYLDNPPEHKAKGVMIDLDDIIEAKAFDLSQFWQSLLQALTLDGKLQAIPNHGHYGTTSYYFNRSMYEEAGVELPAPEWTVSDLVSGAQAMTASPEIWGFRANGGGAEHMASYLRTFGGNFMDAEGVKCLFDQDESIQALRWLYDLQHEYEVDPCICGTDTANNFTAGQVGCFNWTTGYTATFYAQPAEEWTFEWDVMVPPVGPTGLRGSQVSAAAFCITGNSAHPFEAFQVLDFFSTKEDGIEHVFFGAGSPGGRQDVWESEELNSIHPIYRMHAEAFPDGPQPWYRAANARVGEFSDTMNNNLQAIWTDSIGFDEGVTQLYTLCQEVLDKDPL